MKIKKLCMLLSVFVIGILVFAGNVKAVPFTNPNPGFLGEDLDDSGLFFHQDIVFAFEALDLADSLPNLQGSSFGFYFEGDSANLHTIFQISDAPTAPFPSQVAAVDFANGDVFDVDGGGPIPQNSFVGSGTIGFWLAFQFTGNPTTILYTQPSLNPGSADLSGTFPVLGGTDDDYVISFNIPGVSPIALEVVNGITPVPEPSTIFFLGSGLIGLAFYGRKKVRNRSKKNT